MSLLISRSCINKKCLLWSKGSERIATQLSFIGNNLVRNFNDENGGNVPDFSSSTIIVENRLNVQELPVIIRRMKDLSELDSKPVINSNRNVQDSVSYNLIQDEFKQCNHLREVFSLLSKCTKITPNIALGAMERIYELEKGKLLTDIEDSKIISINIAKGAILDKLLQVVIKTEDTQTILNALNSVSSFMEPYKNNFCDELLMRVLDGKLSVEQLCQFTVFLAENEQTIGCSKTIDKLWVGFIEKEGEINEKNIVNIFQVLPNLKISHKTILTLLEEKMSELWNKIDVNDMLQIFETFIQEKCMSKQSFNVASRWLYTNIHALDEDSLLDIITKFTNLRYNDEQIERAVEKYVKLKGAKIQSPILVVGILNYCLQFQLCNDIILNKCSEYFMLKGTDIPSNFLRSFLYPYGYLYFNPTIPDFWKMAEDIVKGNFDKISVSDMCFIILSYIYLGKNPSTLISSVFCAEYLAKAMKSKSEAKKLYLIDTALSLECDDYLGPRLPKDHLSKTCLQDVRIKKMVQKIMDTLVQVAGDKEKISFDVPIPNLFSDKTYLIDIMIHPVGLGSDTFNWKLKSEKNENTAVLIHLPEHYCLDDKKLIGPQEMKKRHLKILGMRVVSIKYSELSKFYTSFNKTGLKDYLIDGISTAEPCI